MMIQGPNPSKENDGKSAKKRKQRRVMKWFFLVLLFCVTCKTIFYRHFAGIFVPDFELNPETGKKMVRRRPGRHFQRLNPDFKTTPKDAALEGYLTLVEIRVPQTGLIGGTGGKEYKASGIFCNIDWKLQQKNPSTVPMFKDLREKSKMCEDTEVQVDLYEFAREARAFDASFANATEMTGKRDVVFPVPPSGIVFHETRCGSTLTANLLASFRPKNSRVYSESPPPVTALRACEKKPCDPDKHKQLIQDVFYLMGRTIRVDRPQYVFYKIQSIGTMAMHKFTMAFPNVPWVFLYRDSVEVMMSHLKSKKKIDKGHVPVCGRNYNLSMERQPRQTQKILQKHGKRPQDMALTEYCAVHLAALSLAAVEEHDRTGKGKFINYNELPDVAWRKLLPDYFGITPIDDTMVDNMKIVAGVYSKGRGKTANQEWKDDSEKKQFAAPEEVVSAAKVYLGDMFEKMERLSGNII